MVTKEMETLSPTKRALLAVKKLQAQVEELEYQRTEPIAIIGMSCRFPGGVSSPEQFWTLLYNGVDAITEVPADRWDVDAYYDADPDVKGKIYNRYGGFIEQVDQFDPHFFGISSREAEMLDPQQRLWLEVCWEALERAAIPPLSLRNSQTGIFASSEHLDYLHSVADSGQELDLYTGTGNMHSITSGRIAHFLGIQGPAITLDTACSSSLVAIHLACQSLRSRDCSLALAGGVNLILNPFVSTLASPGRVFAPDGRCKTFSASANGYTRSDGCAVVVLKRLSDAEKDGDNILAIIRGSAVNHDGHTSGLTVPNGVSQQKLVRQALANANIMPDDISYIEAHGTGTVLGDPIEIDALGAVFTKRAQPLLLGSVKANIGHTEAAAGIAGLMKIVLAMEHDVLPPQINVEALNPHIPWDELNFVIPTTPQLWPTKKQIAGVSSFSLSGTNAHMILEAPPKAEPEPEADDQDASYHMLTLSAKNQHALAAVANRYADYIEEVLAQPASTQPSIADIAYSTQMTRTHFEYRLSVVTSSLSQASQILAAFNQGEALGGVYTGEPAFDSPKTAFLFPGQGAQYVNMGRQLYDTHPIFRQAVDECDEILQRHLGRSLLPLIYPDSAALPEEDQEQGASLHETKYAQPALFTLCYALTQLWKSWGVQPDMVIGHSTGEYLAAYIAGVFTLEDSLRLVIERSRLMNSLRPDGEMAAIMLSESQAIRFLEAHPGVAIAAINGPESVVISGLQADMQPAIEALQHKNIKVKTLLIPLAAHSPMMDPILDDLEQFVGQMQRQTPHLPLISSPFGRVVDEEVTDPAYWRRHLREPVRFMDGVQALHEEECNIFIEISPKSVLLNTAQQCVPNDGVWVSSLREGKDDWQQLLSNLGVLYSNGFNVNWSGLHNIKQGHKVPLPTYPFQRRRYWMGNGHPSPATTNMPRTPIIDFLQQGNASSIVELLQSHGHFTEEQIPLLQNAMQTLVQLQQTQQQAAVQTEVAEGVEPKDYQIVWEDQPRQDTLLPLLDTGVWLILADQKGVGATLAQLLREHEQTCCLFYAGDHYQREGETWTLNPADPQDFARACQECRALGALQGVVHLWSLDVSNPDPNHIANPTTLDRNLRLVNGALLHLCQTLLEQGDQPKIWGVTSGAVPIKTGPETGPETASEPLSVTQGSLWGFGRTLSLEFPHLWGGMLDLELVSASHEALFSAASLLLTEIWDAQGETQIAYRSDKRYVARLYEATFSPEKEPIVIRDDATYLITGGLGALGLHTAQWLVEQGARYLALTGRRGLGDNADPEDSPIAPLLSAGCTVKVIKADVSQADDVTRILDEIAEAMPPLQGIIHAAGVLDDGIILQQDWSRFQTVLAPKAHGGWQLYVQTEALSLDFLIFFSSATALLGSPGQSNYAVANAFLDAVAEEGKRTGRCTLSIGWGSWSGTGLAEQRTSNGEAPIAPSAGIEHLQKLLEQNISGQIGVMVMDWQTYNGSLAKPDLFLSHLYHEAEQEEPPSSLCIRLAEVLPDERQEMLITYLKTEVARILGDYELPDARQGFFDIGMDSLMALQLSNRIQIELEVPFPTTLVFEYPSVNLLTRYLLDEVLMLEEDISEDNSIVPLPSGFFPSGDESAEPTEQTDKVTSLSDDELEALINQEFTAMLGESA